jgi:hypothetical protein
MLYNCMLVMNKKLPFLSSEASESTFNLVLRTFGDKVRFFKQCRFTKCDDCAYLASMKRKCSANKKDILKLLHEAHATHIIWQMFEVILYSFLCFTNLSFSAARLL